MAVKNRAASALARLRNQAKTEGINYHMIPKQKRAGEEDDRMGFSAPAFL